MYIPIVTSSWLIILKESSSFLSLISPRESKKHNVSLRIIVAREQKEISICCSIVCFPHFICRGASVVGGAISFITEDASVSLEGILFTLHYLSCFYEWVGSPWYIHCIYLGLTELYISFTCLSLVTGGVLSNHSSTLAMAQNRQTLLSPAAPQQDGLAGCLQCGCGEVAFSRDAYRRTTLFFCCLVSPESKSTKS